VGYDLLKGVELDDTSTSPGLDNRVSRCCTETRREGVGGGQEEVMEMMIRLSKDALGGLVGEVESERKDVKGSRPPSNFHLPILWPLSLSS
jgi:hypothetical protein